MPKCLCGDEFEWELENTRGKPQLVVHFCPVCGRRITPNLLKQMREDKHFDPTLYDVD